MPQTPLASAPHVARILAALLLAGVLAACGDSGSGPDADTPASVEIANATLNLTQPGQTAQLQVTVRNGSGDALPGAGLFFSVDDESVASVSTDGLVQALGDGAAVVTVRSGTVSSTAEVTVEITAVALQDGVPVTGLDGPTLGQRYFTFQVPAGSDDKVLLVRLSGGTGDADLGLNQDTRNNDGEYDCVSAGGPNVLDNLEFCAVMSPEAGTWHATIYGFEPYEGVQMEAVLVPATLLVSGAPVTDLSAAAFDLHFFRVEVPAGGSLALDLAGGTGDADLFGTSAAIVSVTQVEGLECLSAAVGNGESCSVDPAEAGSWMVFLLAYEAFEGATLTAQVGGGS